jgi:hypothetical protein
MSAGGRRAEGVLEEISEAIGIAIGERITAEGARAGLG